MKVLVTGGLGHIGSRLITVLAKREDIELVRILDNLYTERYCSLFNLPAEKKIEFIEGDVRNEEDVELAMKNMDIVFHLAAITDPAKSFEIPRLTEEVNLIGTKKVIQQALKYRVKKVIYPSTTSVYAPSSGIAIENCSFEEYKPQSPYAKFKLLGEREVIELAKDNNLKTVILRLGTIYGPSIGMRFHTAVNKFIFLACTKRPLTVWEGVLTQRRPYLYIEDAISAFIFMMDNEVDNGGIFNVVTENATVEEIIEIIKEFIPTLIIKFVKSPFSHQFSYFTDDTKIRKLGFLPKGNLRKGIKATIDLFKGISIQ